MANSKSFKALCEFGIKCNTLSCFFPCKKGPNVEANAAFVSALNTLTIYTKFRKEDSISLMVNVSELRKTIKSD